MAPMHHTDHSNEAPPPVDALDVYAELAERVGLIREGDNLDQTLIDFAMALVQRCAGLGDWYTRDDDEGNAGEHIRAELLPH